MFGTNYAEVLIHGQDTSDAQPFCQGDDGSIYKIETYICILVEKLVDTWRVSFCYDLKLKRIML